MPRLKLQNNPWFYYMYTHILNTLERRNIHMGVADKCLLRMLAINFIPKYRKDPELNENQAIISGFEDALECFYKKFLEDRPKYCQGSLVVRTSFL